MLRCAERVSVVTPYLVQAGEESGSLAITMTMAANYAEANESLERKVQAALTYPAFVLAVNVLLMVGMLVYIFPTFQPLFGEGDLPLLTSLMLAASKVCGSPLFFLIAILFGVEVAIFARKPEAQAHIYRWCLHVPVLSSLLRSASRARFTGVLAATTRSGLSILRGLHLAAVPVAIPISRTSIGACNRACARV